MEKLMNALFAIALGALVIMGIGISLAQLVCVIIGNGVASAAIANTLEPILVTIAGVCALIAFLFLLLFRGGFKKTNED